jgi:hypothetical protein
MKDKWKLPEITIDDSHVCYNVDLNHINLGMKDWKDTINVDAPTATIEELYTGCLIHETTHWAQFRFLSKEEKKKADKAYNHGKEKALIEKHAIEIENDWFNQIGKLKTEEST